jgi:CRP-like cAMP-binding protein
MLFERLGIPLEVGRIASRLLGYLETQVADLYEALGGNPMISASEALRQAAKEKKRREVLGLDPIIPVGRAAALSSLRQSSSLVTTIRHSHHEVRGHQHGIKVQKAFEPDLGERPVDFLHKRGSVSGVPPVNPMIEMLADEGIVDINISPVHSPARKYNTEGFVNRTVNKVMRRYSVDTHDWTDFIGKINERAVVEKYAPGELILKKDSPFSSMWLIRTGTVQMLNDEDKVLKVLNPRATIGDQAILRGDNAQFTYRALTKCNIWRIDHVHMHDVFDKDAFMVEHGKVASDVQGDKKDHDMAAALARHIAQLVSEVEAIAPAPGMITLKDFGWRRMIKRIRDSAEVMTVNKEVNVFEQGDPGESMYFVQSGVLHELEGDEVMKTVNAGEYFGDRSLLFGGTRTRTVQAVTDCKLYVVAQHDVQEFLQKESSKASRKDSHLIGHIPVEHFMSTAGP